MKKDWWQKLTEQERVNYLKAMYKWVARKPTKPEVAIAVAKFLSTHTEQDLFKVLG